LKADILKAFGRNVRRLREAQGLSQEELAERAQVHRTYVGMVERAEKNITLRNIEKFAKALQVPITELVERS
jgi:transcriptional regulator with XRE-family HTH domain